MNDVERPAGRIAWPFRAWLWVEVLFGVAAISVVGLDPAHTATRFAWPIEPVVTAAALGGFYLATAPLLVAAALTRRWEMVRVVVLPAVAFTGAELIATLLHLGRFSTGTAPFAVWLASYVLPPPIFLAMYAYHRRGSARTRPERPLPSALRWSVALVGGFLTLDAVWAFVDPTHLSGTFPWALTPLTTRVLSGWLIAIGTLLLSIAWEDDRDRARVASPQLILVLPAVALQVARFPDGVDLGHPRLWFGVALFAFTALVGIILARGSWRSSLS